MEELLHYAWKHRLFPLYDLRSTDGLPLEVLDTGLHNVHAGPDFFNAKVRIGDTVWVGNVELHLRSSDWARHGHDHDPQYNNVVLHVACEVDGDVITANGLHPTQLQLAIPERLKQDCEHLLSIDRYPRCHSIIRGLDTFVVHSWMDTLLLERLRQRSQRVIDRLQALNGDWEKTLFQTLARNFGFGLNGDAFQDWTRRIPQHQLGKHRDELFQIEAVFLGQAGFLSDAWHPETKDDAYRQQLKREYAYQQRLFQLPEAMEAHTWKYLRLRPQNFPHIRLSQLAWMYSRGRLNLSVLRDAVAEDNALQALERVLEARTSDYWTTHLMFGKPTQRVRALTLSKATRHLLVINTVVPVLYAYAITHQDTVLGERVEELLRQLPAEDNHILRLWQECGLGVSTAADSQALIHLKSEYCDRRDCLRCRFGYEYMSVK